MLSEVKGLMLVTLRRYILEEQGQEAFDRYVACAPSETRSSIRDPLTSAWYPEEVMHDALEACFNGVCDGSDARFVQAMDKGATMGTHWFFRMLVSVSTPHFLLRLYPAALRQMRRGPVKLDMEIHEHDATLRFTDHPFADHPQYRLATPPILRAVLRLCVGPSARATLIDCDVTTQVVKLVWGDD
jgi:hypothetical protein